jgi:hypothetical protein
MNTPAPPAPASDDELASLGRRALRELQDAPEWLIGTAIALWRAPPSQPSPLQRIAAVLRFDNWAGTPAPALRSAAVPPRQLLFAAGGRDIDLRIVPLAPARFEISGQVLGPGTGGEVRLDAVAGAGGPGGGGQQVRLDEFGGFRFGAVAAGRWRLQLQLDAEAIDLPELVLGEPGAA